MNRLDLLIKPLAQRKNKVSVETGMISPGTPPANLSEAARRTVERLARAIVKARNENRAVMLAFGAHTIKNGMAPTLIALMEKGFCTHLATNGAGIIHDWELSYQGSTSEDVRANVAKGEFGTWEETGFYLNLAINTGAWLGYGYGESVGQMVLDNGLTIPSLDELERFVAQNLRLSPGKCAAAMDLCAVIRRFNLHPGFMEIRHAFAQYGIQAAACRKHIPFTAHPMFGHDIIYTHPMNCGAAIGRVAERDFLRYADSVAQLTDGVYLSVGSAVMSPMVFEKSLSMSQNLAIQRGEIIHGHRIFVVDLAESNWDWNQSGEPPMDHPAYYLRYCKTFSRMGGDMSYTTADNRDFLLALYQELLKTEV
jgi:hypothetical protein